MVSMLASILGFARVRWVIALSVSLFPLACASTQRPGATPAELRVVAQPPSAVVYVNEQFVGAARVLDKRPARFSPGLKRVTIEAPGYFPHDAEVNLVKGVTTIQIKLRPVPP